MSTEESGHWYSRTGEPAYETNGRGTTLRDARKLNLVPSVTTILGILAKPALTNWLVDQGILAALTMPKHVGELEYDYIKRIKEDSKAQAIAASNEGSRIHDAAECDMKGLVYPEKYAKHVEGSRALLRENFPDITDWVAEKSFAHASGFGGKVDLHSASTGIIVDYKTKDGDFTDGKKLAYDQHYQLAAYQLGLGLSPAPGAAIFISRTHPGTASLHHWTTQDMVHARRVFMTCLELWKLTKGFDPSF